MSMITSHLVAIILATLVGIWLGRRTKVLSGFIKSGG
jgi:hypothetical protein